MVLKERTPTSLSEMREMTERYLSAHGGPMWRVHHKPVKPRLETNSKCKSEDRREVGTYTRTIISQGGNTKTTGVLSLW